MRRVYLALIVLGTVLCMAYALVIYHGMTYLTFVFFLVHIRAATRLTVRVYTEKLQMTRGKFFGKPLESVA